MTLLNINSEFTYYLIKVTSLLANKQRLFIDASCHLSKPPFTL